MLARTLRAEKSGLRGDTRSFRSNSPIVPEGKKLSGQTAEDEVEFQLRSVLS